MQVHLIDGTYELFRAYFGAPSARTADGREVGAVRGMVRSLCALLREPQVTHVACAFDTVIESFRNRLFPGYKTGEGVPEDLRSQFDPAERAVRALGVAVWPMVEFEADDALATAAARLRVDPSVTRVVICSPDKDLYQCVRGERVVCLDRRRRLWLDETAVTRKLGIPPRSVPDYLALVGDAADGIPGVPRFGPKTAARLLARYGTIDAIPSDPREWDRDVRGREALASILAEHLERAMLYRTLATLREDVPLDARASALKWSGAEREAVDRLGRELEDDDLPGRVPDAPDRGA